MRGDDVEGGGSGSAGDAVLDSHGEDHGRRSCKGDASDASPGVWRGWALAAAVAYWGQPVGQLLELAKWGLALEELIVAEDMVKV